VNDLTVTVLMTRCQSCVHNSSKLVHGSYESWDVVTRLQAGQSWVWILVGARVYCFWALPASYLVGANGSFPAVRWLVHETDRFHLLRELRMSGDIPPLPLYVFMVWTGTSYLF